MTDTFPSDQENTAESTKLRHIAIERGLGGLSNNTKWRELIKRLYAMNWCGPHYRYKSINSDKIFTNHGDWHALPQPFMAIEWLDVACIEDVLNGRSLAKTLVDHSSEIEVICKQWALIAKRAIVVYESLAMPHVVRRA